MLIRDKPIFSSERMLHTDYYRKCSVKKNMAVSLKGLGAKKKWLAVNSDSGSEEQFRWKSPFREDLSPEVEE
jgi:hypothetical protein